MHRLRTGKSEEKRVVERIGRRNFLTVKFISKQSSDIYGPYLYYSG
jgi:hypothetical protein